MTYTLAVTMVAFDYRFVQFSSQLKAPCFQYHLSTVPYVHLCVSSLYDNALHNCIKSCWDGALWVHLGRRTVGHATFRISGPNRPQKLTNLTKTAPYLENSVRYNVD